MNKELREYPIIRLNQDPAVATTNDLKTSLPATGDHNHFRPEMIQTNGPMMDNMDSAPFGSTKEISD